VDGLEGVAVAAVSCGDSHAAAVTTLGELYVWGQNESGQLGLGLSPDGALQPQLRPVALRCFHGGRRAVTVGCGAAHTMAIDSRGQVWAWGGAGSACLGLGLEVAKHALRPTSDLQVTTQVLVGYDPPPPP
jgi:alpha-tubulin suppressor-like RCC1 family protein